MAFLDCMIICSSDIYRCQESTSSPAVSNSISEGIIEEEEDEEAAEESNKKRMKEDDQEVLFIPPFFIFQGLRKTSWESWFLLCRCRRKVFSPGESSCRRQKSTGKAGSEASPLFFSPAQHLNFSYSQVSPLAQGNIRSTRTVRLFRWRHTSLNKYKWFKIEVQSYFFLHLIAQFHTWLHLLCRSGQARQRPYYWTDARWEAQPAMLCFGTSAWNGGCKYVWCDFLSTGKFQMQVLPQCGHAVHEDAPEKVPQCLHQQAQKKPRRNFNLPNWKEDFICQWSDCVFVWCLISLLSSLHAGCRCFSNIYGATQIYWV